MPAEPHASPARWIAAGAALLLGTALQLQQPALWPNAGYGALLVAAGLVLWAAHVLRAARGPAAARAIAALPCIAIAALAFALTGLRAGWRLADALDPALERRDLVVVGIVDGLPQRAPEAWRFRFAVESARLGDAPVAIPPRLALGWYGQGGSALPTQLRAGQRWLLTLRLKRPHGAANPHGFDYELWLFEQGMRATGYVRPAPAARLLAEDAGGHAIDRLRQRVRDAIAARLAAGDAAARDREAGVLAALDGPHDREAGVLAALAVGDQAAIEREDWALYRNTGVAHLMSISGLHVTMFAWMAGLAVGWLWRRSGRAMLACPAPTAARWGGLAAAALYALFAGWGVPAQRTVFMLATATVIASLGLRWPWPLVWAAAAVAVTLLDPWALLQPGFWLSFVAVGLLLAAGAPPRRMAARGSEAAAAGAAPALDSAWRGGLRRGWQAIAGGVRTQVVATLGLAPLSLVFFQQLSLVSFAANLVAIPLVTLLVTPLALLGVLLPPLWSLAALVVQGLNRLLALLVLPDWAVWTVPAAAPWAVVCGLLGAALALLPLPWRVRLLALPLLLPLLAPPVDRPSAGGFELLAADVGQGNAVLVRTATHSLLYDAGPQYSAETDAGERVLLPLLRALGERRLDMLLLSHRDSDHVGGADALLRGLDVAELRSSLEPGHALLALAADRRARVVSCAAGQRWQWDGVDFELLHPDAEALRQAADARVRPNTLSCVLAVRGRRGGSAHRVLLAGDLERAQEARLVAAHGAGLRSELLLVPHHGSKTSSSAGFLDAVQPQLALVQAGYRNRFGHPAAEVLARYRERGIAVVATADCGAWHDGPDGTGCRRAVARRYWQHPGQHGPSGADMHNGLRLANPGQTVDDDDR